MSDDDYSRYDRSPRFRDEGYRRPYTGRFFGSPDRGGEDRYRPMAGDYGRSSERELGRRPSQQLFRHGFDRRVAARPAL